MRLWLDNTCEPATTPFEMPDPSEAEPGNDLIALGADLAPGTILAAYRRGLFPMPVDPSRRRSKVAWYSPDPRGILPLESLRVSKSLRRSCQRFEVRSDTVFGQVIGACADIDRSGHWITREFDEAYRELHRLGWAHSVETFLDGKLVGGLYGVQIGGCFAGESMFHRETDASKVALVRLVEHMRSTGGLLLDTQWATPHLESLGVIAIPRDEYLHRLAHALER